MTALTVSSTMGILIVFALGGLAGWLCHSTIGKFWIASASAALLGSATWAAGVYVVLALTTPMPLGPPSLGPAIVTLAAAFAAATVIGVIVRAEAEAEPHY